MNVIACACDSSPVTARTGRHFRVDFGSGASFHLRDLPLGPSTNSGVEGRYARLQVGSHFGMEIILWGMEWCVAYPISYVSSKK